MTGSRMRVPAPGGGTWRVERPAPGFTPAEYARAQALLAVAAAVAPRAARTQVPHDSGPATAGAAPLRPRAADPPAPPPAGGVADTVAAATAGPAALLLADGRELTLRPGGPADLAAVRAMHGRCSPASLHQRYLGGGGGTGGPPDAQLARLLEPARGCALLLRSPGAFTDRVVAMATLVGEGVQAEVALLVEDAWQRRGIGTALLRRAVTVATAAGFDAVVAYTQAQNTAMHRTLRRLGVTFRTEHDGDLMTVTLPLGHTVEPCATGPVG